MFEPVVWMFETSKIMHSSEMIAYPKGEHCFALWWGLQFTQPIFTILPKTSLYVCMYPKKDLESISIKAAKTTHTQTDRPREADGGAARKPAKPLDDRL